MKLWPNTEHLTRKYEKFKKSKSQTKSVSQKKNVKCCSNDSLGGSCIFHMLIDKIR